MNSTITGKLLTPGGVGIANALIRFTLMQTSYEDSLSYLEGQSTDTYTADDGSFSFAVWASEDDSLHVMYRLEILSNEQLILSKVVRVLPIPIQSINSVISNQN